ncbi:MAG: hypothetical protein KGL44_12545, partial [Sphingomonadales bacterium]|nr:hypothetical protein [Sphingomonadales bacterium]
MKAALFAPLIALLLATPARAERLLFDHGLYPALKASLDAKRDDTIFYDDSNPKYVFDRILVHGNSQQDWSEALEIIARTRSREVHSAQDWYRAIISDRQAPCPAQFTVIGQDSTSITFARQSR